MAEELKIVLYGLGAIGSQIAKFILEKEGLEVVGAIDIAEEKIGRDLGTILEIGKQLNITVTNDADALFSKIKADLVVHATSSYLKEATPQILRCLNAGLDVVSTCEELSYPYYKYPSLANEIDRLAKTKGVTVLGTGINPGYLMDALPIALTGPCKEVKSIRVTRMMYSGDRRSSYQKKIGTGLSPDEFKKMIEEGKITGHVGLTESIAMIAAAVGWKLDKIETLSPEPIICENEIKTSYITIKPGQVAGIKNGAHGIKGKEIVITLEFISHANIKKPYDSISIKGIPNIHQKIYGGIHGDIGTVAMVVNAIPKVINANPGLVTMKDLPIPSAALRDMRTYINWRK